MGRTSHMRFMLLATLILACSPGGGHKGAASKREVTLLDNHWNPDTKKRLEALIAAGAHGDKVVVFDFDNTTICRDIGEATLARISIEGGVDPKTLGEELSPPFTLSGASVIPTTERSLAGLYEKVLQMGSHQAGDLASNSIAYAWAVKMMRGRTPAQIIEWTERAFNNHSAATERYGSAPTQELLPGFLRPLIHPEIADLMGLLKKSGYRVLIISASNVWTVRYMVKRYLNPLIAERHGTGAQLPLSAVTGVSVLLRDDRDGALYKDHLLIQTNPRYSALEPAELAHYTLTAQIVYPLPAYNGKVANILRQAGMERPYLAVGDSTNDHPMLRYAHNKLWIARLEKPAYQERTASLAKSGRGTWLFQPVLETRSPGFVRDAADLRARVPEGAPVEEAISRSKAALSDQNLL